MVRPSELEIMGDDAWLMSAVGNNWRLQNFGAKQSDLKYRRIDGQSPRTPVSAQVGPKANESSLSVRDRVDMNSKLWSTHTSKSSFVVTVTIALALKQWVSEEI